MQPCSQSPYHHGQQETKSLLVLVGTEQAVMIVDNVQHKEPNHIGNQSHKNHDFVDTPASWCRVREERIQSGDKERIAGLELGVRRTHVQRNHGEV